MTHIPPLESRSELLAFYREQKRTSRDGYERWIFTIGELRLRHDVGLLEAERIALSNPHMRLWVEKQINTRQPCRKEALSHIRYNGDHALVEREGETFNFKIPALRRDLRR